MSVVMHRKISFILAIGFSIQIQTGFAANDMHTDGLRPIIAQIVTDPAAFEGQRIEIYGLVVGVNRATNSFLLQDVSQRPLSVDARLLPPIAEGDQVEISGFIKRNGSDVSFSAKSVKRVQVIAGGGCC